MKQFWWLTHSVQRQFLIPGFWVAQSTLHLRSNPSTFSPKVLCTSCTFSYIKTKTPTVLAPLCFSGKNIFTLTITNCATAENVASTVKRRLVCYFVPVFFYATPRPTSNFLLTNCCVRIFPPANLNQVCFRLRRKVIYLARTDHLYSYHPYNVNCPFWLQVTVNLWCTDIAVAHSWIRSQFVVSEFETFTINF